MKTVVFLLLALLSSELVAQDPSSPIAPKTTPAPTGTPPPRVAPKRNKPKVADDDHLVPQGDERHFPWFKNGPSPLVSTALGPHTRELALTTHAKPAFYWFQDQRSADVRVQLKISGGGKSLTLAVLPEKSWDVGFHSIQPIDWQDKHFQLVPGVDYTWTISWVAGAHGEDSRRNSIHLVKEGAVAWYDKFDAVCRPVEEGRDNPNLRAQRTELLKQAGFPNAASWGG